MKEYDEAFYKQRVKELEELRNKQMFYIAELQAGIAQLEADKERLLGDHGRMRMALLMITGPMKRDAKEMKELALLGLGKSK